MSILSVKNDNIGDHSFANAIKPLPPTITSYAISGLDDTAVDVAGGQTILINGSGFQRGATVTFDGTQVSVVNWVNSSQLSFTAPAKSAGTYQIYVVNPDTGTAFYLPGIIYSSLPTWTTSAGSLGSYYETVAISNTLSASGDAPVSYSLFSGTLPTGTTLSANGLISGTAPVNGGSTTFSFTVEAIDAQLQSSTRSFSITINTDVVSWSNPQNGAAISISGEPYSLVLNASSAAGYNISSYTANTLPTGLSLSGNTISGTATVDNEVVTTLLTATASTTGRSSNNVITWSVSLGDTFINYVNTLLSGTTSSNTFVDDASTNAFLLSVNGDTRPNSFSPYTPGYYSNYFDGTGDFITGPSNAALNIGTGQYTIEMWIYFNTVTNVNEFFRTSTDATAGRLCLFYSGGSLSVGATGGGGTSTSASYTFAAKQWYHVAASRDGSNNQRLFVNGILLATATSTNNYSQSGFTIGAGTSSGNINGHVSNARIVVGTAVYTTSFTTPTTPLTAIANTQLLTCQSNRLLDTSNNNFTITRNGDTTVNSFDPFIPDQTFASRGSAYFDGTGDFLSFNGTPATTLNADFTVEAWIYPSNVSSVQPIMCIGDAFSNPGILFFIANDAKVSIGYNNARTLAGSGTVTVNAWNHIAYVRSGSTITAYLNGVSQGTLTTSATFSGTTTIIGREIYNAGVGGQFIGYISDLRLVKGTAVYTSNFTVPAAPLSPIANTQLLICQTNRPINNNVLMDNSTNNFLVTRGGNVTQGTNSPYGENWSNYFDGNGDFLSVPNNSGFDFGTGNFTVECWFNLETDPPLNQDNIRSGTLMSCWPTSGSSATGWTLELNTTSNTISFVNANSQVFNSVVYNVTLQKNRWYHFAAARSGTVTRLFLDGVLVASGTLGNQNTNSGGNLFRVATTGYTASNYTHYFPGLISNLRVVKGTALYTDTFTPSATPLQPVANTQILTCASPIISDRSPNNFTITKSGDVRVQKFGPFAGVTLPSPSYSIKFNGSTESVLSSQNLSITTGPFTIEGWIYPASFSSSPIFIDNGYWNIGNNGGFGVYFLSNGAFQLTASAGVYNTYPTVMTTSSTVATNAWSHIAVTRNSSNTISMYINGVSAGTPVTYSSSLDLGGGQSLRIGAHLADGTLYNQLNGSISNLRVVKNQSLYSGNFTPPTSPLTANTVGTSGANVVSSITGNVALLACQSSTIIDTTGNFVLSSSANTIRPMMVSPFTDTYSTKQTYSPLVNGGSMYFDGSDSLTIASNPGFVLGTSDFTIELWFNPITAPSGSWNVIFDLQSAAAGGKEIRIGQNINGTGWGWLYPNNTNDGNVFAGFGTLPLNEWHHIAISKSGSTLRLFRNGITVATTNSVSFNFAGGTLYLSTNAYGDPAITGYISDVRVLPGTALYTNNFVPPKRTLNAIANTTALLNGTNGAINDSLGVANFETLGDVRMTSTIKKYGNSSYYFDGNTDALFTIYSPSIDLKTTYTIEAWIYPTSLSGFKTIYAIQASNAGSFGALQLYTNGTALEAACRPTTGGSNTTVSGGTLTTNTWHHVALSVSNTTARLFLNGTQVGSNTTFTNYSFTPMGAGVGNNPNGYNVTTEGFVGYISDLRISRGVARYTGTFTPPIVALPTR